MPKQTLDQSFQFLLDLTTEKELAQLAEDIVFDSDPEFAQYLDVLAETTEFSLDIETYGTVPGKAFEPEEGEIRLIQVYLKEIEKCLIWDLGRPKERKVEVLPNQQYDLTTAKCKGLDILVKKCESLDTIVNIQNAAFEGKWFYYKFGILIFNIWDSMICSQVIWAGTYFQMSALFPKPHSLASIAKRVELGVLDKENQTYDYALPLHNEQYNYAATDVRILPQIKEKLLEIVEEIDNKHLEFYQNKIDKKIKLSRYEQLISKVKLLRVVNAEMLAIPAFISMRYWGFPVNKMLAIAMRNEYFVVSNQLKEEIETELKCSATSNVQILVAIQAKGFNPQAYDKKTKSMKSSANEEALETIADNLPIAKKILVFRSVNNRLDRLEEIIDCTHRHPVSGLDIITGSFSQNAAKATGRTSCQQVENLGTNLQNIPKHTPDLKALGLRNIREIFQVPTNTSKFPIFDKDKGEWNLSKFKDFGDDERALLIADFSSSHAQISAYIAGAAKFFEARDTGIKLHFYTTAKIFALQGKEFTPKFLKDVKKDKKHPLYDEVDQTYDAAKTAYFSNLNGSGPSTLQSGLKQNGMHKEVEECKLFLDAINDEFKEIHAFKYETNKQANSKNVTFCYDGEYLGKQFKYFGELRTIDGGRYLLQKMPSKYKEGKTWEVKYADAIAIQWLRPEATIIKGAIGLLVKDLYFKYPEWQARLIALVHDEMEIDVLKKYSKECSELMHYWINKVFAFICPTYQGEDHPFDSVLYSWSQK